MAQIYNVSGGKGGLTYLVVGKYKTALLDSGMSYCGNKLIKNFKKILKDRPIDYVLITHSHYDHIGGIPFIRKEWPSVKVLGAKHAKNILLKESVQEKLNQLNNMAANFFKASDFESFDYRALYVDETLKENDQLSLGNITIKVLETPGHTRCSLSYLINDEILFLSESTGYMSQTGNVYPCFLHSSVSAIKSLEKCEKTNPKKIIVPHYGMLSEQDVVTFWKKAHLAIKRSKRFIIDLHLSGYNERQILSAYELYFQDEESKMEQPIEAFKINSKHLIQTVLREYAINQSI